MKVLVTGAAGFIGFHVVQKMLETEHSVVGIDNLNPYYDVALKRARLTEIGVEPKFDFRKMDLSDRFLVRELFSSIKPDRVIHLAAQAGVRYSLENPQAYIDSNIQAFLNILEGCRHNDVGHLVYASSSSVYGGNHKMPFSVSDPVDHPLALYGVTKRANELMAHSYSHLYSLPTTGLRFFTVYGPWGRPDMSLFLFTRKILAGEAIDIFNEGNHKRDFTYIDDIANGVIKASDVTPERRTTGKFQHHGPGGSEAPFRVYNIGNSSPVELMDMISILEEKLGMKAKKNFLPMQPGDVVETFADVEELKMDTGYVPGTKLETGVSNFVDWYKSYYKIS